MLHLCIRGVENRSTNVYDDLPGNLLRDTQLTWCLDIRLHYRGRDPHELTQKQKLSRSIASGWLEFDEWCEGFSDLFARTSLSESDPK